MYTISVANKEYLQKLMDFANREGIYYTVSDTSQPYHLSNELRPVKKEFKTLCGTEWLNKKGEISEIMAFECIKGYAKARNLDMGGKINLDEELQYILSTTKKVITPADLSTLIQTVFI